VLVSPASRRPSPPPPRPAVAESLQVEVESAAALNDARWICATWYASLRRAGPANAVGVREGGARARQRCGGHPPVPCACHLSLRRRRRRVCARRYPGVTRLNLEVQLGVGSRRRERGGRRGETGPLKQTAVPGVAAGGKRGDRGVAVWWCGKQARIGVRGGARRGAVVAAVAVAVVSGCRPASRQVTGATRLVGRRRGRKRGLKDRLHPHLSRTECTRRRLGINCTGAVCRRRGARRWCGPAGAVGALRSCADSPLTQPPVSLLKSEICVRDAGPSSVIGHNI